MKSSPKIFMTRTGYEKIEKDLTALREKREPTVLRLQAAREQGDLSENGAYKAARFELSDIDRNIRRLTYLLKDSVIREPRRDGVIGFASTVVLEKDGHRTTYTLVSKHESDPSAGKLSLEGPLGASLVGKKAGETASFTAPAGTMTYRIVDVR